MVSGLIALLLLVSISSASFAQPNTRSTSRLDTLAAEADLVFKGKAVSTRAITNTAFPYWAKPYATDFLPISILKGHATNGPLTFLHLSGQPHFWSGPSPPQPFSFQTGRTYLLFAVLATRPDRSYSPPSNYVAKPAEFRQPMRSAYALPTLDHRPLQNLTIKEAHWLELNLLLHDSDPTNQLLAVETLDQLSLAGTSDDAWRRTDDFQRTAVLKALLPLFEQPDDQVACRAFACFATTSDPAAKLGPFAGPLIAVANNATHSNRRRLCAIRALSGTSFQTISNSLARLLSHPDEQSRVDAIALLPGYPGDFAEHALRQLAADSSPKVRSAVADAIGRLLAPSLLPTLATLFADPVGRDTPIAPLTPNSLQAGGRIFSGENGLPLNVGDVHTSAGYALLNFDVDQVDTILKSNLDDPGFRLQFLCKLAGPDPAPWIDDMLGMMETWRDQKTIEAANKGLPPETFLPLTGTHYRCWRIIYDHLKSLPYAAFANGKSDRHLQVLENAGTTGSREPTMLYELYKMKGLNSRAAEYRARIEKKYADSGISQFLDRIDARYPDNGIIPNQ